MWADLGAIYDDTITVINKLDAKDAALKMDTYYPTVIEHCMWSVDFSRTVNSDASVSIGAVHKVQIPESENYQPYRIWKDAEKRDDSFTLRPGDYIIKGKVEEEINATTIKSVVRLYEPDAFQIQTFRDATKGTGFMHYNEGIMRFSEVYYVEG